MSEEEGRRLRKICFIFGSFCLGILLLGIGFSSYFFNARIDSTEKRLIAVIENKISQISPKAGADGYTPIKNIDYFDGKDGKTVEGKDGKDSLSTQTIIEKNTITEIFKEIPIKGDRGEKGDSLDIEVEPDTCLLKKKLAGDDTWNYVAQLPFPCKVPM